MELNLKRSAQAVEPPASVPLTETKPDPIVPPPSAPTPREADWKMPVQPPQKDGKYLLHLLLGLLAAFAFFYALADYTASSAAQIRPGEMIFSNTMIQLWTAAYRLVFIIMIAIAIVALLLSKSHGLWQFFKHSPGDNDGFDLAYSIKHDLTPTQRVWLFFGVVSFLCYLFVLLLTAKLGESASVLP